MRFFDPRGAKEISRLHAPRLDTLAGKTIALVSNDMWQAHRALPVVGEMFARHHPEATVLPPEEFPRGNSEIDSDGIIEALKSRHVDAVVIGNAACGACATACGRASARIEAAGIPTVLLTRADFADVTRNAVASLGFDQDAALVPFPIDLFIAGSDLSPLEGAFESFVEGLTRWRPQATETGIQAPPLMEVESPKGANDPLQVMREVNRVLLSSLCGDGLPLYPPTPALVDWILEGADLPRDHVVGKVMPRGGIATLETVAVSLAMAGGRPEYLPVLVAALEAVLDPAMEHAKAQANSGSPFPVVVVNGPVAFDIRLNSGFGLLGPDPRNPAGGPVGRALRFLLQNVGGALPGQGTMASFGSMRFTNAVFAEAEADLPEGWEPLASDYGLRPGGNAVTLFAAVGGTSAPRRAISPDDLEREIINGLHRTAAYMRVPNRDYVPGWAHGTPGGLLISPVVAGQIARLGWSKERLKRELWELSKVPRDIVEKAGLTEWIRKAPDAETRACSIDPWPICRSPDQIVLAVAGGAHPSNFFWFPADAPAVVSRPVALPARWDDLLARAEEELGPGGAACRL